MTDFLRLFEDKLTRRQIQGLLKILKAEEFIYFDGIPRSVDAFWKYKGN